MDDKTKELHERAAVALENHALFSRMEDDAMRNLAMAAFDKCSKRIDTSDPDCTRASDIEAARLLRECVARNEVLK